MTTDATQPGWCPKCSNSALGFYTYHTGGGCQNNEEMIEYWRGMAEGLKQQVLEAEAENRRMVDRYVELEARWQAQYDEIKRLQGTPSAPRAVAVASDWLERLRERARKLREG